VYCADCGFGLWKVRDVMERPTQQRSVVALVCLNCFMERPFGTTGQDTDEEE
jgi:RNase P subunit RPR2